LVGEAETHSCCKLEENKLVGAGLIVAKTVATAEEQAGVPGFITCKVKVLVPEEAQLSWCGPTELGVPPAQPSQVQLKVAPAAEVPV
jgi:hypothetical protein